MVEICSVLALSCHGNWDKNNKIQICCYRLVHWRSERKADTDVVSLATGARRQVVFNNVSLVIRVIIRAEHFVMTNVSRAVLG